MTRALIVQIVFYEIKVNIKFASAPRRLLSAVVFCAVAVLVEIKVSDFLRAQIGHDREHEHANECR